MSATTDTDDRPHAVVTGGAGFLGSHLVDALLADGYRVTVLDNYGSGRPENLDHVEGPFELLEHDVREPYPDFQRVDQLYHFASRASPADFEDHAVEIALTNSVGAKQAFETAREYDAPVILASTSEVYGDPEVNPQPETYTGNVNVRGPRAPYDESKRFSESLAVAYRQQYGLDVRTVRIFNTYGPRMRTDDGRAIPNFLSQALEADAELAAGEAINVGNTHEITILELAETILDVVDSDSGITYRDLPEDDPQVRKPDISKARERLDWEPSVDLETGLERTVAAFREELDR
jgi:nucleoside-diphosphate-sugar epimerase